MKYISAEGLRKLEEELKERKTKKRKDIAKRIEEAKALGDLSENAEYAAAKEAQSFNEGRILELEEIIREATLMPETKKGAGNNGIVQIGSVIEVKSLSGANKGEKKEFTIVGFQEADPSQGRISNESPLGRAFLDRRVNDTVEIETPKGQMKYKILKIK